MPSPRGSRYNDKAIKRNDKVFRNELQLIQALNQGPNMPVVVDSFLRSVFNDKAIMGWGSYEKNKTTTTHISLHKNFISKIFGCKPRWEFKEVKNPRAMLTDKNATNAERIYRLYNQVSGDMSQIDRELACAMINDIQKITSRSPIITRGHLQNIRMRYSVFAQHVKNGNWNSIPAGAFYDFYYFDVNDNIDATYRVYLNVKPEKVEKIVSEINGYLIFTGGAAVESFKVSGPSSMSYRTDNIVIYVKDKNEASHLANYLRRRGNWFESCFNTDIPNMTKVVSNGISIGAEPENHVATGFGRIGTSRNGNELIFREKVQKSFGSLRSQAIAAAVINYNENKNLLGASFENFKKFVAVSFRSFGIDPNNPWDNV